MRNNKIATAGKTLLVIGILTLIFSIGAHTGQDTSEPQIATNIYTSSPNVECRVVGTHTVQYVEKPVTVTEYVERVQRVSVELRNFSDLEELKQWLIDRKNVTTVRFQSPNTIVD